MTNFMTKLKTGIAIGALIAGTMLGAAGAQALTSHGGGFMIGGYEFNNPWTSDLLGQTYNQQANAFIGDPYWTFATQSIITQAMSEAELTTLNSFVGMLGFDTTTTDGGSICSADLCWIRLNDITQLGHRVFVDTGLTYPNIGSINDNSIGGIANTITGITFSVGALAYHIPTSAPSPEVTGLMIGGLGLMGFAALRRK